MKNEGWSWEDLAGELWARGIDIDDVPDGAIHSVLNRERPEDAAEAIDRMRD